MKYASISGTGSYLPSQVMTNFDLEQKVETSDEWIYSRTGIRGRCIASETETASYMAAKAAERALEAANLQPDDIDLIIAATCTQDNIFPGVACYVQNALGITKPVPAFDLGAACSGFIYALDVAYQYIANGGTKNVLVIGSEVLSKAVDWTDRSTCILFGDGAGAVVLSESEKPGILSTVLHAAYDKSGFLTYEQNKQDGKPTYISMSGNEVFKLAVNIMGDIVDEVLGKSNLRKEDIDWLIPHQANIRIIKAIAKKLHLPMSKVIVTLENQGNTSAASIPLALDISIRNNKIKRGDCLLLEAFGGGMTWGAVTLKY